MSVRYNNIAMSFILGLHSTLSLVSICPFLAAMNLQSNEDKVLDKPLNRKPAQQAGVA